MQSSDSTSKAGHSAQLASHIASNSQRCLKICILHTCPYVSTKTFPCLGGDWSGIPCILFSEAALILHLCRCSHNAWPSQQASRTMKQDTQGKGPPGRWGGTLVATDWHLLQLGTVRVGHIKHQDVIQTSVGVYVDQVSHSCRLEA